MSWTPSGKHFIAGEWIAGTTTFQSEPARGPAHDFAVGTTELVDRACRAAEAAFAAFSATTREERAIFLEVIAEEIDKRGEAVTLIGTEETGLPEGRLNGERGRTTGQLRLFADHIRKGAHLDARIDAAQPDRQPAPRPEIRLVQRPIGPVAVFGASNFPLAFSTAGGDTAAALAAGCPVVVKGHSAHPGTGEIIAEAIAAAIERAGMPAGVFSLIQGGRRDVGTALVTHPAIKAVGFTGSLVG
ncbi:aldehyde dehydrogenase family protein, partial [Rhizobium sp.]